MKEKRARAKYRLIGSCSCPGGQHALPGCSMYTVMESGDGSWAVGMQAHS